MKLYLIVLFTCILELKAAKLNNKKTLKSIPQSAIIAIQIIDPNENKTSSKGSKRTIDSSLGYGYQSIFGGRLSPRYETYKYSQHDLPPYTGPPPAQYTNVVQSQSYEIQPSKEVYSTDVSNHYEPGTILFSTINQRGQLGELSSQLPVSFENHHFPIPVIILRVHPNQLSNPVYPKLPQNHFLASAINSIDINSLLSNYANNNIQQNSAPQYQPQPQPQYQEPQTYVQQDPADYQNSDFQSQLKYPQYQYEHQQQNNQNYQSYQEGANLPEPHNPEAVSQYHISDVNQPAPLYQQPTAPINDYSTTELLTHENYPSDKHTRVIFKRTKGKRRNTNKQSYRPTRVKSTKSYTQPQETQTPRDEISNYNKKYTNTNTYNPVQIQSSKSQPAAQDNQIYEDKISQYDTKYDVPDSSYTNQYPQSQQYEYSKEPQYEEGQVDRYQNVQPVQETQYIYISEQPRQHNSDV